LIETSWFVCWEKYRVIALRQIHHWDPKIVDHHKRQVISFGSQTAVAKITQQEIDALRQIHY
jgi:hypothetical protein